MTLAVWLLLAQQAPFTDELWRTAQPIVSRASAHPFLRGLADGTLPKERFRYYMRQDKLYLAEFARALEQLAGKTANPEYAAFLRQGAKNTVTVEAKLHETFFTAAEMAGTEMAPTNAAYTSHLLATVANGTFAEGLAAVLPCYWIYWEVGRELKKRGSRDPDYQRWVNQYSADAFGASVKKILAMMNAEGARLDSATRARVQRAFALSSRYEYMFWDMAWRQEEWPVR